MTARRPHLVIDARRAVPGCTGIGECVLQLCRRLPEHATNWRISAIGTAKGTELLGDVVDLEWREVPFDFNDHLRGDPWRQLALPALLRKMNADAFHGPGYFIPAVTPGIDRIVTIHDLTAFRYPESNSRKHTLYMQAMIRLAVARAHLIMTDTAFIAEELRQHFTISTNRMAVVPLGVSEPFWEPPNPMTLKQLRNRFDLPGPYLFTTALFEPRKNIGVVLRALHNLIDDSKWPQGARLVIGGRFGWKCDEEEALIRQPPLRDVIIQTDFLDRHEQRHIYAGASAYVLPSHYEGFGLPVLEALATGTRLLCSNASCLPEVAGEHADYFDPDDTDHLSQLMLDAVTTSQDEQDKQKRRAYAKGWSWDRTVEVYCRTIAERLHWPLPEPS